jgi:protein TonB
VALEVRQCPFDVLPPADAGAAAATASDATPSVLPLKTEGLGPPHLLCAPSFTLTREAADHHASGIALAQCVIDVDGTLCNCRMVRSVPYMDDAILAYLSAARYTPVLYKGKPQRVQMMLPIRIHPVDTPRRK